MPSAVPGFRDVGLALAAGCICALLIVVLRPWFVRFALARPNARSSHKVPTPQGGGAAVVAAVIATLGAGFAAGIVEAPPLPLAAAVVLLAIVGGVDDVFAIPALPRLVLQAVAVGAVVAALPAELRVLPALPLGVERAAEVLGGVWFVNLTNFMDGIDWMTVAETVPVTAAVFLFSLAGAVPAGVGLVALVLCGAMLGFAPFNRPVARLFLGDVGSLPIGLIVFYLMVQLAGVHLAAALLLPLYYVADATLTLLRRIARRERLAEAHRTHFYQLATARGLRVMEVVGLVFGVNVVLAGLAGATLVARSTAVDVFALAAGGALVAGLLALLSRGRP